VAQVQAVIENVPQNPGDAFTVSGNTITFTSAPPSGTNNIYVYYTSPITQVVALPQSPQVFGNLQFSSSGARITGDFSNATQANRVVFQTSTTNGNSVVGVLPNGTATTSVFRAFNNSDPTNSSEISLFAASADVRVISGITGTGTYLPLTFQTGGSETARFSATAKTLILAGGSTSANGTGITFPATQSASSDANTLDDYEEGTFTVTNEGDTTGTISDWTGEYVKVGRTIYIRITAVVSANFSNNVLGGLPFTVSGSTAVSGISGGCVAFNSSATSLFATPIMNTTQVGFYTNANTNNPGGLTISNQVIRASFVYRSDS
jgi:hypothetical protein